MSLAVEGDLDFLDVWYEAIRRIEHRRAQRRRMFLEVLDGGGTRVDSGCKNLMCACALRLAADVPGLSPLSSPPSPTLVELDCALAENMGSPVRVWAGRCPNCERVYGWIEPWKEPR
jgi:hypothetical protein